MYSHYSEIICSEECANSYITNEIESVDALLAEMSLLTEGQNAFMLVYSQAKQLKNYVAIYQVCQYDVEESIRRILHFAGIDPNKDDISAKARSQKLLIKKYIKNRADYKTKPKFYNDLIQSKLRE